MSSPHAHAAVPCEGCRAPILWTVTAATGRRMPVDAEPDQAENTAVYADGTGRLRSRAITGERPTLEHAEQLHMPHAATCTVPRPRRHPAQGRAQHGVRPAQWQRWQR